MDYKKLAYESLASQDEFEMWQLMEILAKIKPKFIVEIGVDKGHSMATWKKAFKPEVMIGINDTMEAFDFDKNDHFHNAVLVGDSHDDLTFSLFLKRISGAGAIDFLFIDGDHTAAGVRKDYEMYGRLVRPGGIIAMHDTMRLPGQIEGVEVYEFFQQLRVTNRTIEFWGGLGSPGTGVIFK